MIMMPIKVLNKIVNVWMWSHGHMLEANLKSSFSGLFTTSELHVERMTS